jgi:hypothetical protein
MLLNLFLVFTLAAISYVGTLRHEVLCVPTYEMAAKVKTKNKKTKNPTDK